MIKKQVRTRFAPSPTGYLHVGGLEIMIFAYIFAKQNKGEFLLRIEDTDKKRELPGAKEALLQTIANMGFVYDEGPILKNGKIETKGKFGPYIQSERLDIYQKYVRELINNGHAYYCFCTPERLDTMRGEQQKNNQPPKYDRTCRNLTAQEIQANLDTKVPYVIRMKIPDNETVTFNDLIKGDISFNSNDIDDQVLLKSDGYPTYHLAVVVDDHLMQISHVIRGDDWLSSTPKHLLLYKYFDWKIPYFAHLSLLLNTDRTKLSKRKGDVAVEDFLQKGYLKEALINFIATIGWNEEAGNEQEIYSLEDLIKKFDITRLSKSGAIFNLEKLDWINSHYIRAKTVKELTGLCLPYLKQVKPDITQNLAEKVVAIEQERLKKLEDINQNTNFLINDEITYQPELLVWKKSTLSQTKENLGKLIIFIQDLKNSDYKTAKGLEEKVITWIKENNYGVGDMLWPMRVALSGQQNSPSPFEIAWVIGKETTVKRISMAISNLKSS
ncbi:MAG: glutamate--tRNA ligase [Candidatus Parcubacteria bacterium]|nr:glutamate--tRNA ligase [Candidatus Parcubacteria bacterium]